MRPLAALTAKEATGLRGLIFDLDDTLLDRGALREDAYSSLFRLKESGLLLIPCTGRPAGWLELIVRQWPVDGGIAENGVISFVRKGERIEQRDGCSLEERRERRARLTAIRRELERLFPDLTLADDNGARISDVTFDIGEHHSVSRERVAEAVLAARSFGVHTLTSSVHLHLTFDRSDKAQGAISLVSGWGFDESRARSEFAFIGDSENDAAAFSAFRTTFGVANIVPRLNRLTLPPRYLATFERGRGFAEVASVIASLRPSTPTPTTP